MNKKVLTVLSHVESKLHTEREIKEHHKNNHNISTGTLQNITGRINVLLELREFLEELLEVENEGITKG